MLFDATLNGSFVQNIRELLLEEVVQILINSDSDALLTVLIVVSASLEICSHLILHVFDKFFESFHNCVV